MNLNDKIEKILKDKKVKYTFIPLPEDLARDVPSHAAFHHIKLDQAMTTILYKTEKGLIAAVKRADTQVNESKLKQLADVKQLIFAKKEDLDTLGVETGMVPYLALPIPFFVDKKVLGVGLAYGTAGVKTLGMAMEARDMVKVNQGVVDAFADFTHSQELPKGKRLYSAIAPSGDGTLHIGNYLGAVRQFIELAKYNECFFQLATIHALTTIQDRNKLAGNIEALTLNELALLGDNPNIYFCYQSDIPYHTELQSILNNVTPLGLLKRAHAYKDKLAKETNEDDINLGLFNYPILMASDILVYKATLVPVGKDQKQHVEIARDIADRFNRIFKKNVFPLPEPYIPEEVAVILGTDGKRKMSKTLGNIISIFEDEAVIHKQVMGCYTDPTRKRATDPGHIAGNMVFTYLDFFGKKSRVDELKTLYEQGKIGDVEVKEELFQSLMTTFAKARERYKELSSDRKKVEVILKRGRERALDVASKTMQEVREAVGFTNKFTSASHAVNISGSTNVSIDDFAKIELKVGKVLEATNKEGSDKLIRLVVDVGEEKPRIIFTGVRPFGYTPDDFAGKQFFFITNLAPRKMLDEFSQGMILAVDGSDKKPIFVSTENMPIGSRIR